MPLKANTSIYLWPEVSRLLAFYLSATHLAALCVIVLLSIGMGFQFVLGGLVLLSFFHCWRSDLLGLGRDAVYGVEWDTDGDWTLETGDGHRGAAVLSAHPFVHPWFVILHFKSEHGRRHRLILPRDALDSETLRRLRVCLRLKP